MSVSTLEQAPLINELLYGQNIGQAVHSQRRADFSLLLAMLSDDVRDNTPVEKLPSKEEVSLSQAFSIPKSQALRSDENSYPRGEEIAKQFNLGGLTAARLQAYLAPDALAYMPEKTSDLPEEVYHNLSQYQRQKLQKTLPKSPNYDFQLYNDLVANHRQSELCV